MISFQCEEIKGGIIMKNEIIRASQIKQIKTASQYKKALYFCAHTGWGKTTLIRQYFSETGLPYFYLSANDEEFCGRLSEYAAMDGANIVIDDIQDAADCEDAIAAAISESGRNVRFFMLGRCGVPQYLKPFLLTGQMTGFGCDFFAFSADDILALFMKNGKTLTAAQAKKLCECTKGWCLGIWAFMMNYSEGKSFKDTFDIGNHDIFEYFNERLFNGFDEDTKSFLLHIGHLAEFTEELARMVCGASDIRQDLTRILSIGSFIRFEPPDRYIMIPIFNEYLMYKQKSECSEEFMKRRYESTALYYVLKDDIANALKYYSLAGNKDKLAKLLLKNAEKHPGNGHLFEIREYYFSLPDEIAEASPELMTALSMIYSISGDPEKSEEYFSRLEAFEKKTEDKAKKKTAQEKLAYLRIALPHRGIRGLPDIFKSYMPPVLAKKLSLQDMSITGNMPSLMNGGKDFCEWSKNDRMLYKTLRRPVTLVLGRHSAGLPEIALGESLFEKNTDGNFTEELTLLNSGYYDAETSGNIQLQFAALSVMSRIYSVCGKAETAIDVIKKFKERVKPNEEIAGNIEAFLVSLYMLTGSQNEVNAWFSGGAPDENSGFYIMDRYRYLTKIRAYIIKERYGEALSLLSRADKYFTEYERVYCHIEALILKAIVLNRLGDEMFREVFDKALSLCGEYRFTRIVSRYGAAVLDMLKDSAAGAALVQNTRQQAVLYPNFLKSERHEDYGLTESERTVLKLICDGLTNEEIANLTETTVRTVKFHLSNIYRKLNVKGRTGAINLCLENKIV